MWKSLASLAFLSPFLLFSKTYIKTKISSIVGCWGDGPVTKSPCPSCRESGVHFPESTWRLTTACNSRCRGPDTLFSASQAPALTGHRRPTQSHRDIHVKKKITKSLQFFSRIEEAIEPLVQVQFNINLCYLSLKLTSILAS